MVKHKQVGSATSYAAKRPTEAQVVGRDQGLPDPVLFIPSDKSINLIVCRTFFH